MNVLECMCTNGMAQGMRFKKDFEVYDTWFHKYKDKPVNVLEIGVQDGGGIWGWRKYFKNAKNIVGLDIVPGCKRLEDASKNVFVEIGDQTDEHVLQKLVDTYGPFDIVIDDGGHTMHQHQTTFEFLFPTLNEDALYCIEDLQTCYFPSFGYVGDIEVNIKSKLFNMRTPVSSTSTLDYFKAMIDSINFRGIRDARAGKYRLKDEELTYCEKYLDSVSFYESIIVAHKKYRGNLPINIVEERLLFGGPGA